MCLFQSYSCSHVSVYLFITAMLVPKALLIGCGIDLAVGLPLILYGQGQSNYDTGRKGNEHVTLSWVVISLLGMMPYWIGYPQLFRKVTSLSPMSGFSTTGASILSDIEAVPRKHLTLEEYHSMDRWHWYYCLF